MIGPIIVLIVCFVLLGLIHNSETSSTCNKVAVPPNRTPVTVSNMKRKDTGRMGGIVREAEKRKALLPSIPVGQSGDLKYFVVERALATISAAEQLIVNELDKYHIKWYREVAFEGFMLTSYSYARYDFLIELPGGIMIVEYDGADWHQNEEQIARDKLKTAFCKKNKIPLVRYNKKDYYHLEDRIGKLMEQHNIRRKIVA